LLYLEYSGSEVDYVTMGISVVNQSMVMFQGDRGILKVLLITSTRTIEFHLYMWWGACIPGVKQDRAIQLLFENIGWLVLQHTLIDMCG
jgi:hypothetical protein